MTANISRYVQALVKFDAVNAVYPNRDVFEGVIYPKELRFLNA